MLLKNEETSAFVLPDSMMSLNNGYGLTKLEYAAIHIAAGFIARHEF